MLVFSYSIGYCLYEQSNGTQINENLVVYNYGISSESQENLETCYTYQVCMCKVIEPKC